MGSLPPVTSLLPGPLLMFVSHSTSMVQLVTGFGGFVPFFHGLGTLLPMWNSYMGIFFMFLMLAVRSSFPFLGLEVVSDM